MRARQESPGRRDGNPASRPTREDMLHEILRKIAVIMDRWRECPARACRRARGCVHPAIPCTELPPRPGIVPVSNEAIRAELHHAVKRRMAEIEQGRAAAAAAERPRRKARRDA